MTLYETRTPPRRRGRMIMLLIVMLVVVALLFGGIFGFKAFVGMMMKKGMAGMKDPPQTVSTAVAGYQTWQPRMEAVGSLRAVNGTDLAFETSGIVDTINFKSGEDVAAGTVLATLRPDDTTGRLDSLKAQESLAEITLARDQKQLQAQAVAQATIDSDNANLKNLKAQVAQEQALIDERVIHAPFAGHLGIRQIDLGQYVGPGTTVVTLQALDPIYIDFYLPQQALEQLKVGEAVGVKVDTYPGRSFDGQISAINPKVDTASRNIQVRATIHNPKHELLPGMYGTVEIASGQPQSWLTLPQTAITFQPYGDTVYLVEPDDQKDDKGQPILRAHQTFVTTGETRGDQIAVLKGLKQGDTVVTNGQMKLHNNARLAIDNKVQPLDTPDPTPQEQ